MLSRVRPVREPVAVLSQSGGLRDEDMRASPGSDRQLIGVLIEVQTPKMMVTSRQNNDRRMQCRSPNHRIEAGMHSTDVRL